MNNLGKAILAVSILFILAALSQSQTPKRPLSRLEIMEVVAHPRLLDERILNDFIEAIKDRHVDFRLSAEDEAVIRQKQRHLKSENIERLVSAIRDGFPKKGFPKTLTREEQLFAQFMKDPYFDNPMGTTDPTSYPYYSDYEQENAYFWARLSYNRKFRQLYLVVFPQMGKPQTALDAVKFILQNANRITKQLTDEFNNDPKKRLALGEIPEVPFGIIIYHNAMFSEQQARQIPRDGVNPSVEFRGPVQTPYTPPRRAPQSFNN